MMILWETKRVRPRKEGSTRRESYVMVVCPRCQRQRELSVSNARTVARQGSPCGICQRKAAGRKGYQATVAKVGGHQGWLQVIAQRQLDNPVQSELIVGEMLAELVSSAYTIQQQVIYQNWILDFAIYQHGQMIAVVEVNGYWHNATGWQRDINLQQALNCKVLFVDAEKLETSADKAMEVLAALRNFLITVGIMGGNNGIS